MSTAEDGGATANATTSSYGGGGAGGKFRKKPLRRQATPYDRPPTNLRANNTNTNNSGSWLKKLVVEPASKLISYGAGRFFGSVFRRSLPPPPPPPLLTGQPAEINAQESDGDQGEALISQGGELDPGSGQCSLQTNTSSSSGFAELEHLLNQKTFTRSEIAHLTQLLQSQALEKFPEDANQINVVPALDTARQKEITCCVTEGNRNDGIRTSIGMFTPTHISKVLENDIASPAELARAYMGSKPSQISPSRLGMRNQLGKESTGLLPNTLIATKSPTMTLAKKTSVSLGAAENGFVTPRSRGRSAIYNMARTPYSRVHSTSIMKGSGINGSGYAGPSTSSSSFSPMDNDENFNSRSVTLKRRSSVLNDEVGSVGPMRRIRQKANLLTPRFHHTSYEVGIGSHAKQKPQLNAEEKNVLKKSGENDNESAPSTSYGYVPSKSREVAAKILQQLEKLSPNEKSSESKIAAAQEKSPSKLISSRLPGQALRRMEDVDSSSQKQDKAEQNEANVSIIPSSRQNPVLNNDSTVSLKSSTPGIIAADAVVKNGKSQPQKKRAFRMSAEEDSLERDNVECNGLASKALTGNSGPHYSPQTKTTIQCGDKSFSGPTSRSTSEPMPAAILFGKGTNVIATSASEGIRATSESQVFASLVPVSDRPKEANGPNFFSFSSKSADKVPLLPSESIKRAEIEPESSTSLSNIPASIGSEFRTPRLDSVFGLKPVDTNGKCDDVSSDALNVPVVSSCSPVSFTASSVSDMNRVSTGSAPLFTTSTSVKNFVSTGSGTTTTAPSSGSVFGFAAKSSSSVGPFSASGSPVDLSSGVSAAPTVSFSDRADQRAKIDINPSSGSSSSSYSTLAAPAAASSGNGFFKLGSSFTNPTGNSIQGSLFSNASKTQVSGVGTVSQGSTIESVSAASVPALNNTSSSSLGSLPTPSLNFGFSSTSSSGTTSLVPAGGPTPSLFKFGTTPTAVSDGSAVTPIFGSGGASVSSSSATNIDASSSGPAASVFGFGGASVSAFSSGTSVVYGFGGSSLASFSTVNAVSSSTAPFNDFGSGWQNPKSPIFGSMPTSTPASPSTGFSFTASTNAAAPLASNSPFVGATSAPSFSFTSAKASSSPPLPKPIFGNQSLGGGFAASPANSNQMNAEDSMAEDPVPSSASVHLFGQPSLSPSPPVFAFGSTAPSQNNPFMLNGQQSLAPQDPSPFQASASQDFNPGGSFSLGSGGGDKSGRRIVKINRNKNRKK